MIVLSATRHFRAERSPALALLAGGAAAAAERSLRLKAGSPTIRFAATSSLQSPYGGVTWYVQVCGIENACMYLLDVTCMHEYCKCHQCMLQRPTASAHLTPCLGKAEGRKQMLHMQRACLFAGASTGGTFVCECSDRIPVIAKLKGTLCFLCCQVRTDLLQILHLASSIIMTKPGTLLRGVA